MREVGRPPRPVRYGLVAAMGRIVVVGSRAMHLTCDACQMVIVQFRNGPYAATASVQTPCYVGRLETVDLCLKPRKRCRQEVSFVCRSALQIPHTWTLFGCNLTWKVEVMLLWRLFRHGNVLKYNRESKVMMYPVDCHSSLTHVSRFHARVFAEGRDDATYPNNSQLFTQTAKPLLQK